MQFFRSRRSAFRRRQTQGLVMSNNGIVGLSVAIVMVVYGILKFGFGIG